MYFRMLFLTLLLAACGRESESGSELDIVGGERMPNNPQQPSSLPSAIGLIINGEDSCSGVRIGENTYLTAVHCFEKLSGNEGNALVFASNTWKTPVYITNIRRHPSYVKISGTLGGSDKRGPDIAIFSIQFRLKTIKNDWDKFVIPAKIDNSLPMLGRSVVLAGYGCESKKFPYLDYISVCDESPGFAYMKTAKNKVIDVASHYFSLDGSTQKEGITGFISNGDSGGPVYSESGLLMGITSSSTGRPLGGTIIGGDGYAITTFHSWVGYQSVKPWIESALSTDALSSAFLPYLPMASETLADGTYIGEIRDGMRNGKGRMFYLDGKFYDGAWINNVRSGFGIQTWDEKLNPKFISYEGKWANDLPNGDGTLKFTDGHVYSGVVKDGKMHGKGATMVYPNGDIRVGDYIDGKREGEHTLSEKATGKRYLETYLNDKRTSVTPL